jgi:hypothetical protein
MPRTELVHQDATLSIGVCRNLVVYAWFAAPDVNHLRGLGRELHSASLRNRGGTAGLGMVVAGTPLFTDGVRDEMVRVLRDPRHMEHGVAHVVKITGLAGVATRAFLSTSFLLARSTRPNKVFDEVSSAASWLVPLLAKSGDTWRVGDVLAVVDEVRGG